MEVINSITPIKEISDDENEKKKQIMINHI